ncbi:MAG: sulfatase [Bacteroidota bacterium]
MAGCAAPEEPPNIIVIFADDLGYGDVGAYGHPTIRTPHLDQMALEGVRFTQFYAGASVCTPSRAALLTGRLPVRSGMASDGSRVLFPDSRYGLPASELTLAEVLREEGYATAALGKWHLGHRAAYLPTRHGFDVFFGIPYSNDMSPATNPRWDRAQGFPPLPLMRNEEIAEEEPDQHYLTPRLTAEATAFMEAHQDQPFFLYLAHPFPHVPLFASPDYAGTSAAGLYGDVIEELDGSVGEILAAVRRLGLERRTLVVFTSDNGPWLTRGVEGGSAGPLRDGKGTTWEGGLRVPAIAWWPGTIAPGVTTALASTLDLLPTAAQLAGATLPDTLVLDGVDLMPLLTGTQDAVRDTVFYYRGAQLWAVRQGPWKVHFTTQSAYVGDIPVTHDPPLLFHLEHDPAERLNVAPQHPEVAMRLQQLAAEHRAATPPTPSWLDAVDSP